MKTLILCIALVTFSGCVRKTYNTNPYNRGGYNYGNGAGYFGGGGGGYGGNFGHHGYGYNRRY